MCSPVSCVLETFELLEHILRGLSMRDLFVLKRVSRTWKDVIERSQSLRKSIFLLADREPLRSKCPPEDVSVQYNRPLRLTPAAITMCFRDRHDVDHEGAAEERFPGYFDIIRSTSTFPSVVFNLPADCGRGGREDASWRRLAKDPVDSDAGDRSCAA